MRNPIIGNAPLHASLRAAACGALMFAALISRGATSPPTALPPEVLDFCAAKERQARELARKLEVTPPKDYWSYFQAVAERDWTQAFAIWDSLRQRCGQYQQGENAQLDKALSTPVWQPLLEVELAIEQFIRGEPAYALAFGKDIIASIPAGSIYFGGTDPGRGLITALSKSQIKGEPFFTLTQNALADRNYLAYLREIYSGPIATLTDDESAKGFAQYLEDAQRRLEQKKLKPGEDVRLQDGKVSVSGQVAVMAINGLLTKAIFDKNPTRDFFVEESFPLDWMYPHLSPNGLIMKVNRKPVTAFTPEEIRQNHEYWSERVNKMIGPWLTPKTPVQEVCAFAEKVFAQHDLDGFKGDPKFVSNEYAPKMYSKSRTAIGGLYAWRAAAGGNKAEREQMLSAADFSFRQALALCPSSPEAVYRYVNLLLQKGRVDDALLVANVFLKADPGNQPARHLIKELERMQKQSQGTRPGTTESGATGRER